MHAALCTERVVTPAQDTANALKLALQPAKSSTNMMRPDGDSGVTHSGKLNERPPDSHLLAEKPGAGGAPPYGAILERLANKDQVNTTEEGVTLDCGRDKVKCLATYSRGLVRAGHGLGPSARKHSGPWIGP